MKCENCGTELMCDDKYCPECGIKVENIAQGDIKQNENVKTVNGKWKKVILGTCGIIAIVAVVSIPLSRIVKVHYTGEKWYETSSENTDVIEDVESFTNFENETNSIADEWSYGHEIDIYGITEDEEYYYAENPFDDSRIYKIPKNDYSKREKMSEIQAGSLNIGTGKIYFQHSSENTEYEPGIYCMNLDGSELEQISDDYVYNLILVNDWLYYTKANDSYLYKLNVNTRNEVRLSTEKVYAPYIRQNTIYYLMYDPDERNKFCSMNVNGEEVRELTEWGEYYNPYLSDDLMYYIDGNGYLCTLDLNSCETTVVKEESINASVLTSEGKFYYIDSSDDNSIAVYDPVADKISHFDTENVDSFEIIDDMMIWSYVDRDSVYKSNVNRLDDGSYVHLFD